MKTKILTNVCLAHQIVKNVNFLFALSVIKIFIWLIRTISKVIVQIFVLIIIINYMEYANNVIWVAKIV
jgi:hypothetical protein